jgi:hypothetical protein
MSAPGTSSAGCATQKRVCAINRSGNAVCPFDIGRDAQTVRRATGLQLTFTNLPVQKPVPLSYQSLFFSSYTLTRFLSGACRAAMAIGAASSSAPSRLSPTSSALREIPPSARGRLLFGGPRIRFARGAGVARRCGPRKRGNDSPFDLAGSFARRRRKMNIFGKDSETSSVASVSAHATGRYSVTFFS